jgi:hypothetical protein
MSPPAVTLELLAELVLELRADVAALRAESSEVLDVPAVRARYRLRDPRAARAIMREASAFTVARRLLVHRATLEAWELERAGGAAADPPAPVSPGRRAAGPRHPPSRLPADFWNAGRASA